MTYNHLLKPCLLILSHRQDKISPYEFKGDPSMSGNICNSHNKKRLVEKISHRDQCMTGRQCGGIGTWGKLPTSSFSEWGWPVQLVCCTATVFLFLLWHSKRSVSAQILMGRLHWTLSLQPLSSFLWFPYGSHVDGHSFLYHLSVWLSLRLCFLLMNLSCYSLGLNKCPFANLILLCLHQA